MLNDTTLLQVVDKEHLKELKIAWKTWEKYKPEITELPLRIVYDEDCENGLKDIQDIIDRPGVVLQKFSNKKFYKDQREAMLTSFFEGIRNISTKHYLKLDTDVIAYNDDKRWLKELEDISEYVFISKPWGISNKEKFLKMEEWCSENKIGSPLTDWKNKGEDKIKIHRIISWFFLGNVEWNNKWSEKCWDGSKYVLPIASHDSFLWHIAERNGDKYKKVQFKDFGFDHGNVGKMLKKYER
jgi:hypothetical protein